MGNLVDLHIHSQFSDGQFNIKQLVTMSKQNEVSLISITDHDDIQSAIDLKRNPSIRDISYINGVEISSTIRLKERNFLLHILGYGYNYDNGFLQESLNEKKKLRLKINREYLLKLRKEFPRIFDDILETIDYYRFGRLSNLIDKYLKTKEINEEQMMIINKYLNNNKIDYPNYAFEVKEAIHLIKQANGYAILAHPYQYKLTIKEEIELLEILKGNGLSGIEVYHSGDNALGFKLQENLCNKFNFEWTVGSDFHEDYDDFDNMIGYGKNNNLCKKSCSLIKRLSNEGKIFKR